MIELGSFNVSQFVDDSSFSEEDNRSFLSLFRSFENKRLSLKLFALTHLSCHDSARDICDCSVIGSDYFNDGLAVIVVSNYE
jgi:hypothetical protein